jgi:molybdopterin molybdotransferase
MARLSDDCFAFDGRLLGIEEGVALIAERVPTVAEIESVSLAGADGRILGEDILAPIAIPSFDNSAVDGWAVRHADLAPDGETILPSSGRVAAGDVSRAPALPGEAVRIFTGAPMPDGADTVFMQEDVRELPDGRIVLPAGLKAGANRRRAGEDIGVGRIALPAGRRLRPQDVALAAALGLSALPLRRRLRVAVLSTGNELVAPGEPLLPGQVYDSNRPLLLALLRRLGVEATDLGIVRDEPDALAEVVARGTVGNDLVLASGGVSTGDEDHTRRVIEQAGRLVLWRIAIKPGRPIAMGLVSGIPVVGLPGNPVAAFVTFAFIVRPLLARLAGEAYAMPAGIPLPVNFSYRKREGRREYVRVRVVTSPGSPPVLEKHRQDGAAILTSLTETDGLAELPEALTQLELGDPIGFFPYSSLV